MITYNGNFVSKIKYNGTELSSLNYAGTTVWKSQYCKVLNPSLTEIDVISLSPTDTGWQGSFEYNVPLTFTSSASWCSIANPENYGVDSVLNSLDSPTYRLLQFDLSCSVNTEATRSAIITVKNAQTGDYLTEFTIQQAGVIWTTISVTCTCNPTTISANQSDAVDNWTVNGLAYKTQTSSIGTTRNVAIPVQYTFTSNSVIDYLEQIARPAGDINFKYTVWREFNKIGSATITFAVSADGYTDAATCRITVTGGVAPVPNKSMTLNFRSPGISNVWLFNSTVSNMNLSTNNLYKYVVSGSSLKLTWNDTLTVNTSVGGLTSISEGDRFYVYYSAGSASTIGQTIGSSASYVLKDGSSVTIA